MINQAMRELAKAGAIFVGQGVEFGGVATYKDLEGIPKEQRIEFPVAEELQLGFCAGLSLQGFLVVSIFPRCDFLMRAMDQLVNHLDKLEAMSHGQFKPKVIIRTRVGTTKPLDAGPQHTQDHTKAFKAMLTNVEVVRLNLESKVLSTYRQALRRPGSSLIVEALC